MDNRDKGTYIGCRPMRTQMYDATRGKMVSGRIVGWWLRIVDELPLGVGHDHLPNGQFLIWGPDFEEEVETCPI